MAGREDPDETVTGRMDPVDPTATDPPLSGHRIEIDVEDADALADFFVVVARLVRARRRIVLVVE